jgi:GntR family transcriptional regulator of arabinose operon
MRTNSVTTSSSVPATRQRKYQQILDHLCAEIFSGRLAPGDALPTEAEMAVNLGISRGTIRHALNKLVQDGAIYRVQGRGTFVSTVQQRQARQQIDVFALIAPELREGFYPSLVHGFEQTSATIRHQVLVGSSGNETGRQGDLVLQMIDRCVGGVALVPTTTAVTPAYQVRQLQKNQIPVVFCHRNVEGVSAPCVTWSGHEVGRQAGVALVQNGHRHLGWLFNQNRRTPLANDYENGLRAAIAEFGDSEARFSAIEYRSSEIGTSASEAIKVALEKLWSDPNRPTAIFCGNMPDAEQVYLQAESLGLKIPRDLSLVAFSGTWRPHGLSERISCIAVDEYAIGAKAAELLHEMRSGKRALDSDERIEFPVSLLQGETIGPAAKS